MFQTLKKTLACDQSLVFLNIINFIFASQMRKHVYNISLASLNLFFFFENEENPTMTYLPFIHFLAPAAWALHWGHGDGSFLYLDYTTLSLYIGAQSIYSLPLVLLWLKCFLRKTFLVTSLETGAFLDQKTCLFPSYYLPHYNNVFV